MLPAIAPAWTPRTAGRAPAPPAGRRVGESDFGAVQAVPSPTLPRNALSGLSMLDVAQVRRLAAREGWTEVQFNQQSAVLGFKRGDQRVNVYYSTGTVGTCLDHPRAGKTQLFRRNRTLGDLKQIFRNPRAHSGTRWGGESSRGSWRRSWRAPMPSVVTVLRSLFSSMRPFCNPTAHTQASATTAGMARSGRSRARPDSWACGASLGAII